VAIFAFYASDWALYAAISCSIRFSYCYGKFAAIWRILKDSKLMPKKNAEIGFLADFYKFLKSIVLSLACSNRLFQIVNNVINRFRTD
jgi:hypothetical protein